MLGTALLILFLFGGLFVLLYFFIIPKWRKDQQDTMLEYIGTVEERLMPFTELPGLVKDNAENIRTLIDMMHDQQSSFEASPKVLKENISALAQAKRVIMMNQAELGRLSGDNAYMAAYIEGSEQSAANAANRLGKAVHNIPIDMLETIQVAKDRHSDGSSTLRKKQVRDELKEARAKAEDTSLRAQQTSDIKKEAAEGEMDAAGEKLSGQKKRVAKALEKELKSAKKRANDAGTLEEQGLDKLPTKLESEADVLAFIEGFGDEG